MATRNVAAAERAVYSYANWSDGRPQRHESFRESMQDMYREFHTPAHIEREPGSSRPQPRN
ncbi:hypothetical protein ABZY09_12240 [Streptomyces sp. NPDC002928]|uniref:hypothetical protein n=1 Tax=Streptomyces sp. NPDC002928 TaxID=3154440 RepID=UPI0033A7A130